MEEVQADTERRAEKEMGRHSWKEIHREKEAGRTPRKTRKRWTERQSDTRKDRQAE